MKTEKKKTYAQLKKKLDEVFSIFIRKRDKGKCFTCYRIFEWKQTDAGHFINRSHLATRWDERNVHAQCWGCNRFRNGKKEDYAVHLEQLHGHGILQELQKLRDTGDKPKYIDLINLIEYYKLKIEKLEN
jgi:5-methylcytosine-specific restriction endonuclease McrA